LSPECSGLLTSFDNTSPTYGCSMFKGNLMCYERFCNIPDLIIEPTLLKEGICEAVTRGAHPCGEEKKMRIDECVAGIDEECGNGE
jgi:hypothetical protein